MSTTYYRLYKEKVLELARSIVIKNESTAFAINRQLELMGYPISDDPRTWKYYLNLAGEYHFLDRPMQIISLDTLETIPFTKENLRIHLATADEYRVGSRYYNDLVERFPDQEVLIRGILSPVEMERVIEADDFTILYADESLIESNESNLLGLLQERVYRFASRWDVPGYRLTDDLYNSAQLGILFLNLPMFIMNIRLANCRTRYAHSFHIREYLASHGKLDLYIDQLTKKQMLFLYRNILYIERNAGKQETFDWLVDRLLTDRGIPLAEYTARHNLASLPNSLYPELELKRERLNRHHNPSSTEERTLIQMLEMQESVAPGNLRVMDDAIAQDTIRFRNSRNDRLNTKVLESAIVDRSDSGFVTNQDFLLNHWVYLASTNRYRTILNVPDPRSGDRFQISAKDGFILFLYCYNKSIGQELPKIPEVTAKMVRKIDLPTKDQVKELVESKYVDDFLIDAAYDRLVHINSIISSQVFIESVSDIYQRALEHRDLYSLQQHNKTRGQLQAVCDHLYQNVNCVLEEEQTDYALWLRDKGLDFSNLTTIEYELLANNILQEATGLSLFASRSMVQLQDSLIRLMSQLSSYSIQFLKEINRGPILVYDWATTRVGDVDGKGGELIRVKVAKQRVRDLHGRGLAKVRMSASSFVEQKIGVFGRYGLQLDPTIKMALHGRVTTNLRVRLPKVRWGIHSSDGSADDIYHISPPGGN